MSEMIDRVAKALCVACGDDPDRPSGVFDVWWKSYRDEARAAIEAMREPTEAMVDEATIDGCPPRLVWSIMLDAALSEKP